MRLTRPAIAFTAAALLFVAGSTADPSARVSSAGELSIKVGFLINFPKFVDWPSASFGSPADAFVVGVLGDDPLAAAIVEGFKDRRQSDRIISVIRMSRLEDLRPGHMLYIGESEEKHLEDVLKRVETQPLLTIATLDHFAERGGMIQLFTQDGKVRFALNSHAARKAGLAVSSRLLSLAGFVVSDQAPSTTH